MSRINRKLAIALLVAAFATGCTDQSHDARVGRSSRTPSREVSSSPDTASADHGVLRIRRELPEGPIFVEGSAAHARVTDSSGTVVLSRYFDVPEVPGASDRFPRHIRADLPPGRYRIQIVQRPCDGSACSATGPKEWGQPTLRCQLTVRLTDQQIFTVTAVVGPDECRPAQRSVNGQLGS